MRRSPRATVLSKSMRTPVWRYHYIDSRTSALGVLLFLHKQNDVLNAALSDLRTTKGDVCTRLPALIRNQAAFLSGDNIWKAAQAIQLCHICRVYVLFRSLGMRRGGNVRGAPMVRTG